MNYLSNLHLTNSSGILIAVQYSFTIKKILCRKWIFLILKSCKLEFLRVFKEEALCSEQAGGPAATR